MIELNDSILRIRKKYLLPGSLGNRLLTGVSWSLASSIVQTLCGMAISVFCGRYLGREGFGELSMLRSTALLLAALAGSGFGTAATKFAAEYRQADPDRTGRLIGYLRFICVSLGSAIAVLCFFFSNPIADFGLNARNLAHSLQIAGLFVPFHMLLTLQAAILGGFEAFRYMALLAALDGLLVVAVVPAGTLLLGVDGALWSYVVVAVVGCLTRRSALASECRRNGIRVRGGFQRAELRVLCNGTTPFVILWIVWQGADWLARLPVAHQMEGYAELGVFTAALSWCNLVMFLPQQLSAPGLPILANLLAAGEARGFRRTAYTMWLSCAGLAVVTAIPLIALSKVILSWYGPGYSDDWLAMVLLVSAFAMSGVARVPALLLIVSGRAWSHCGITLLWGATLCTTAIALREHGAVGLALSYLLAYIVYLVVHATASVKVLRDLPTGKEQHAVT
jgi:O-antigen/teichoic acid export membrane protein